MACMLRIVGDFDPEALLTGFTWDADWWRKGEPNHKGVPRDHSGIQLCVSDAGFDELAAQVADAIEFLTDESSALSNVMGEAGVTEAVLDFGIAQYDQPAYSRRFPAPLVKLAGRLG